MLITLLSIAPVFIVAEFSATLYIVLGLVAGSLLLTHTVFHGIRYAINPEKKTLSVKIGFFKHGTYDIMDIKSIKKTNTWLSSPAASMDRIATVSYTHLRAHETREDLVCRLLLEKKK